MHQTIIEKIKKYVEKFDFVFSKLKKFRCRKNIEKFQNFFENFRVEYQIELFKHRFYIIRQKLLKIVMKLKNVEHRLKKKRKKKQQNQKIQTNF